MSLISLQSGVEEAISTQTDKCYDKGVYLQRIHNPVCLAILHPLHYLEKTEPNGTISTFSTIQNSLINVKLSNNTH